MIIKSFTEGRLNSCFFARCASALLEQINYLPTQNTGKLRFGLSAMQNCRYVKISVFPYDAIARVTRSSRFRYCFSDSIVEPATACGNVASVCYIFHTSSIKRHIIGWLHWRRSYIPHRCCLFLRFHSVLHSFIPCFDWKHWWPKKQRWYHFKGSIS